MIIYRASQIFELLEPFGPTITDARLQALVLSEEVRKAGAVINEKRKEQNMPLLDIYCIPLVGQRKTTVKISSSRIRELEHEAEEQHPSGAK
jgi:pantetheine-phosphate adenylyltransferase